LILGEQHYFAWKNASQSTKCLYFLKIFGGHGFFGPPGYAYGLKTENPSNGRGGALPRV